jgi:hypothetical protein
MFASQSGLTSRRYKVFAPCLDISAGTATYGGPIRRIAKNSCEEMAGPRSTTLDA